MRLNFDSKIYADQAAVSLSIYCKIIKEMILQVESTSVTKTIALSFLAKNHLLSSGAVYNGRSKNNLLEKAASEAFGKMDTLCFELRYILAALELLADRGCLMLDGCSISLGGEMPMKEAEYLDSFCIKLFNECVEADDAYIVQELIRYV